MKFIIKLFSLSFIFCSILYFTSGVLAASKGQNRESLNCLFVGFDSSPANTDVLCLASYDNEADTLCAVQIPRDTAIKYGDETIKINAFYSRKISEGATHQVALNALCDHVSLLLGINIDGYAAFTSDGLADFVDFLGGIYVEEKDVPSQLSEYFDVKDNRVFLSGEDAISFVRYRKDYTRGDLDRLDAQKVFIKSLLERIGAQREFFSLIRFVSKCDGISFEMNKERSISFLIGNVLKIEKADFQIATLPGEAVKWNATWYYVVNRDKAIALISGYFPHSRNEFDKNKCFVYDF